jgi:hypothetical protein
MAFPYFPIVIPRAGGVSSMPCCQRFLPAPVITGSPAFAGDDEKEQI